MIGQATTPTPGAPARPRDATPAEKAAWKKAERAWGDAQRTTRGMLALAHLGGNIQAWADSIGAPIACMTPDSAGAVQAILTQHNKLDRVYMGIRTEKYYCTLQRGDIAVIAPPHLTPEQYEQDQLGIAWVPILIGALVVAALLTADAALDISAKKKSAELKRDIIQADKEMALNPDPEVRKAWKDYKKINRDIFRDADRKSGGGLFDKIFGPGSGLSVAIVAALALGLIVFSRFGRADRLVHPAVGPAKADKRLPISNPCGGGPGSTSPDQWDVTWSKDPKKADSQLNQIIDRLGSPKHLNKWRDYFAYGTGYTGDVHIEEY